MIRRSSSPVDEACRLCLAEMTPCSEPDCSIVEECEECQPCDDEHCLVVVAPNYGAQQLMQPQCCDQQEYDLCCPTTVVPCTQPDCSGWSPGLQACSLPGCNPAGLHHNDTSWLGIGYNIHQQQNHHHQTDCCADGRFQAHAREYSLPESDEGQFNYGTESLTSPCSTSGTLQTDMTDLGGVGMSSLDPFHCHWNNCDLSFLDAFQFDQHFLDSHIKPLHDSFDNNNKGLASVQLNIELSCAWNQCGIAEESAPALFDHVKHDHVAAEEHHRCKWLVADIAGNIAPCNLCFSTVKGLTEHVSHAHVGSRQKEYVCYWQDCDRCTRPFSQRQKIMRHIVVHTGDRPCKCDVCGYTCSEDAVLRQHKRIHTGEKPFPCTVCHKTFSASTALSVHMRTHTGFKPLTCKHPGCGKRFSESSNLAKHMRTHSAARPFVCDCPGCSKSFQRPDQLKRHKKSVHKQVDMPAATCTRTVSQRHEPSGGRMLSNS